LEQSTSQAIVMIIIIWYWNVIVYSEVGWTDCNCNNRFSLHCHQLDYGGNTFAVLTQYSCKLIDSQYVIANIWYYGAHNVATRMSFDT